MTQPQEQVFGFFNEPTLPDSDPITKFHTDELTDVAIDFETYYDSEVSVRTMGNIAYFEHPKFDPYLITVVGNNGAEWEGNPKDFDFHLLDGLNIVAHNMTFDGTLLSFGHKNGWWASYPRGARYYCTADMASYLRMPRALDKVIKEVYPDDVPDKSIRTRMNGREFGFMKPADQAEVIEYGLTDSRLCLRFWMDYRDQWPEIEREVSRVNRKIVQRGIHVDAVGALKAKENLLTRLHEADKDIPWIDHQKRLSRPAFDDCCREHGITPPISLDKKSPEAEEFFKQYGEKFPFVLATKKWRDVNSLYKKCDGLINGTASNGRFYGALRYGGGHTLRFSGKGASVNLQNPPREEMHGVDFRPLLIPAPGSQFVNADWAQIEVRTLAYLAGDWDTLKDIEKHPDFYQLFAERFQWWKEGDEGFKTAYRDGKPLRHMTKTTVLGSGFQAWGPTVAAGSYGMFTDDEATEAVKTYRESMPLVVDLWKKYQEYIEWCAYNEKELIIDLPSGRKMNYGRIWWREGERRREFFYEGVKGGRKEIRTLYGGKLTENLAQAVARDILAYCLVRLDKFDIPVILHIHDEVLAEVRKQEAERVLKELIGIMEERVEWAPEIPLTAEGKVLDFFSKD